MTLAVTILCAGAIGYVLNAWLIRFYVRRKMPNTMDTKLADGTYLWETTSGKRIVPKWVSFIGLVSMLLFIVGLIYLLVELFS
jgi:hypothetical protein